MVAMNLDLIISTPPEVIVALTKATGARAPTQNDETNSLRGMVELCGELLPETIPADDQCQAV
jgi:hypothetical protein